jgi:hypothetical protein
MQGASRVPVEVTGFQGTTNCVLSLPCYTLHAQSFPQRLEILIDEVQCNNRRHAHVQSFLHVFC